MKRLILATLLAFPMIAPTIAMADPGSRCHFHGKKLAAESTVLQCASQRKASLIEAGNLEKIWASVQQASIDLVDGKKAKEWRVIYQNPAASDNAKSSLYLFFTPPGNFIAANHTGN